MAGGQPVKTWRMSSHSWPQIVHMVFGRKLREKSRRFIILAHEESILLFLKAHQKYFGHELHSPFVNILEIILVSILETSDSSEQLYNVTHS